MSAPRRASRGRLILGAVLIAAGLLIALNGLVSGPHAVGGGAGAVVTFVAVGLVLIGLGAWLVGFRS